MSKIKHGININSKSGAMIARKLGEAIEIGDNIRITYTASIGNEIRLLVEAPKEMFIYREKAKDTKILRFEGHFSEKKELVEKFRKENKDV